MTGRNSILRFMTVLVSALLLLSSCEYKDLCYDHDHTTASMKLNIDWSEIFETPSGISLMFFPADGGDPITVVSNSTESVDVALPEGEYNILVFNQTISEYESVSFHNMDSWEDCYVELADGVAPSWTTRAGNFSREPAELMVGTVQNFGITAYMIASSATNPIVIELHPHPILLRTNVVLEVSGIQYARQVRGVITGMAKRFYLTRNCTGPQTTGFSLPEWSIDQYKENANNGAFKTDFISFGVPNTYYNDTDLQHKSNYYKTTRASFNLTDPVYFDLDVLLVDNETIVSKSYQVSDRIVLSIDLLEIDVNVGIPFGEDGKPVADPQTNYPIELPHVDKPESETGGGFSVSVQDWGEEEVHDVEL